MPLDIFNELQKPIGGKQLSKVFPFYVDKVCVEKVADTPGIALARINKEYGVLPDVNGNNIAGITLIRDLLFRIATHQTHINAFAITAAHTHWADRKPIIYKFFPKKAEYIIGPHPLKKDGIYIPVSFVFDKDYPVPYEWYDCTTLDQKEFSSAMGIIRHLNNSLPDSVHFGIALDYRFKKSLFDAPVPSVELPIDTPGDRFYGFSKIISLEYFANNQRGEETEQVAWHPFSDLLLNLKAEELEILRELREYLSADHDNQLDRIKEVEYYLKAEQ